MCTYGFSQALTNRRVISAAVWVKCECTEATQMSNPARKSGAQSTPPSGSMFSSVPCSSAILPPAASARSCSRWASIFSSVIRCMGRSLAWSVTA